MEKKDKQRAKIPLAGQSGSVQSGPNPNSIYSNLVQPNLVGNVFQPQFNYDLPSIHPNQFAPLVQNVINPNSSNLIYSNQSVTGFQGNHSLAYHFNSASTINLTSNFQSANLPANLLAHNPVYNPADVYRSQPDYVYTGALPGLPQGIQPLGIQPPVAHSPTIQSLGIQSLGIQSLGIQPPVIYSSAIQQPGIRPPDIRSPDIQALGSFQTSSVFSSSTFSSSMFSSSISSSNIDPTFQLNPPGFSSKHEENIALASSAANRRPLDEFELRNMQQRIAHQHELEVDARVQHILRTSETHLGMLEMNRRRLQKQLDDYNAREAAKRVQSAEGQFAIDQGLYLDPNYVSNYVTGPTNYVTSPTNYVISPSNYVTCPSNVLNLPNQTTYDYPLSTSVCLGNNPIFESNTQSAPSTGSPFRWSSESSGHPSAATRLPADQPGANPNRTTVNDDQSAFKRQPYIDKASGHQMPAHPVPTITRRSSDPSSRSILASPQASPSARSTPDSRLASPSSRSILAGPQASPSFGSTPASPLASPSFGSNPTSPFASSSSGSTLARPLASSPSGSNPASPLASPGTHEAKHKNIQRSTETKTSRPRITTIKTRPRKFDLVYLKIGKFELNSTYPSDKQEKAMPERCAGILTIVFSERRIVYDFSRPVEHRDGQDAGEATGQRPNDDRQASEVAWTSHTMIVPFDTIDSFSIRSDEIRLVLNSRPILLSRAYDGASSSPSERQINHDPTFGESSNNALHQLRLCPTQGSRFKKSLMNFTSEASTEQRDNREQPSPGVHPFRHKFSIAVHLDSPEKYTKKLPESKSVANSSPEDSTKSSDLPSTDRPGDSGNQPKAISNVVQPKADPLAKPIVVQPKALLPDNPIVDLIAPLPDKPTEANDLPPHSELKRKDIDLPSDQESKRLCGEDSVVSKASPTAEPNSIDLDQSLNSHTSFWADSPVLQIKLSDLSSSESPGTTESAESGGSPKAREDSSVAESPIVGQDSPPVEMPTAGQDLQALSMPIVVQGSSADGRRNVTKKTVAVQQRPKFGGCVCKTRCSSNNCACFKDGRPCSTEICDCVSCYNPWFLFCVLNIHVGHLKQDRCVMKALQLLDYESLRKLLSSQFNLPCCKAEVNLSSSIPGTVFCNKQSCLKHLRFSWCKKEFVFLQACQHCQKCDTCVDLRRGSCKRCQFAVDA